jgi:hypothetical protein
VADPFSPVAANSVPPDPNGGLNTLSKILNVRSQKLGIQGQQLGLQGQQADVQQKIQDATQRQAAASYFKNLDFTNHVGPDGTLDLNSVLKDPDLDATGDAKPQIIQGLLNIKSKQQDNAASLMKNNATAVQGFGEAVNSLRNDPDVQADNDAGRAKVKAAITSFSKQGPDQARIASIYSPVTEHAPPGKLDGALNAIGLQAQSVSQQQQQQNPQQATTGAGTVNRDPQTGAITAPPGAAPGSAINPTPPQVAEATNRGLGGANADRDRANIVSNNVAGANRAITITKEVDDLADQVHSGKFAEYISKAAAAAGKSSDTYARQLLEKDLGTLKSEATAGAPSDQRQATVLSGFPDATSDSQTIHTAMDYRRGMARQDLARGNLLNQVKSKDPNIRGFQHADDVLTGSTDPLMHEFASLKPGAERQGFYKRNFGTDAKKMEEFRDKVAGMGHLSVIGQ